MHAVSRRKMPRVLTLDALLAGMRHSSVWVPALRSFHGAVISARTVAAVVLIVVRACAGSGSGCGCFQGGLLHVVERKGMVKGVLH